MSDLVSLLGFKYDCISQEDSYGQSRTHPALL
jgi:hypothetical protein